MEKEFNIWKTKFGYMFMEAQKYTKPSFRAIEIVHSFKAKNLFEAHQEMNSFLGYGPFVIPSDSQKETYYKEFSDD